MLVESVIRNSVAGFETPAVLGVSLPVTELPVDRQGGRIHNPPQIANLPHKAAEPQVL
jgi:hypothetical protein